MFCVCWESTGVVVKATVCRSMINSDLEECFKVELTQSNTASKESKEKMFKYDIPKLNHGLIN